MRIFTGIKNDIYLCVDGLMFKKDSAKNWMQITDANESHEAKTVLYDYYKIKIPSDMTIDMFLKQQIRKFAITKFKQSKQYILDTWKEDNIFSSNTPMY